MRPTFLAFQTASRAMAASQANIDVTGNNIANVNTEGYTRQRADLNSISSGGYIQKYMSLRSDAGFGVEVSGIRQIRDPFLDARYRKEASESGRLDTILSGLSGLENVIDEVSTEGLQAELSSFINSLQTLSQTPTSNDISLIVRTAAQKVTRFLNIYSIQIDEVRNQHIYELKNLAIENDINSKLRRIAELSDQIRQEQTYGNKPNELLDKRNFLIDELSKVANIKVSSTPEKISEGLTIEALSISLHDSVTGTTIGLVKNGYYNTLSVNTSSDKVKIEINSSFDAHDTTDITDHISGGSIKGYLDIINGKGTYAAPQENNFRGSLYYRNAIDTFASNFAEVLNKLNTIDPNEPKPLLQASDNGVITSANIRISDQWVDDPCFITNTTDSPSSGGADNILRMISAMNSKISFYKDSSDTTSAIMFEGSFGEYLSGLIGELALDASLHKDYSETSANVLSSLYASRESISGVSLDEEGINLMAYQKSYNAAARYFTVLDEAVDTIINKMGIVGR